MRRFRLVMLGLVLATASACAAASLRDFEEPVVTLQNLTLNGLGITGGSVDISLNVYNPNRFRLDGTRLRYTLWVDSVQFGSGETSERFVVQDGDSATVTIPLDFTYAGVGSAWRSLQNTGTVNYRVAGDIDVGTTLGTFTVPYDRAGRFSPLRGTSR
jgi:LEA14-like dessication related protein